MFFASDNSGPVHPEVLQVLAEANQGYQMGYGADDLMDEVRDRIRTLFEAPEAAVYLVINGTSANALALATLADPWDTVFCTPVSHIHRDECNAPEFYTGAKLTLVQGDDKMTPEALCAAIEAEGNRGVHGPQRGPVSITQVTECGTLYTLEDIRALGDMARGYGLPFHLDGARFANALVALGCSPAEMTWKAGVDVVSFGGTKNGLMGVEAVILFDPAKAREFELRRKRGGHLLSKHRYLSAQMAAYLRDDLWLRSARMANDTCNRLAGGLRAAGAMFMYEPQANMIFARLPRRVHRNLIAAGAVYHMEGEELEGPDEDAMLRCRLVCDWSQPEAEVTRFLDLVTEQMAPAA
ncbi:aminotransferase class V-fold PLP-dependent enzyme [Ruegeria sp. 2205SS24-7]|uniref:threonine aldolase family protein n=1 Tax=Ruegeria discodermiae TaxID=3064389 RepID=UPI0027425758|nr:beta-eliminating lyase-related protein [Ruegeria sp. 2205SS24-7]MDP5218072.1 aminotransferase class V-fold PLP-dependent enzyme [Ruegeria sp. 2205SS24-7]